MGRIMREATRLKVREKELLLSALLFLDAYEQKVLDGSVEFQLLTKMEERAASDRREETHRLFVEEVRARAAERHPVSRVEVDMGEGQRQNLTLLEGQELGAVVAGFCRSHNVDLGNAAALEKALRARVVSPSPLLLMLGVVVPSGDRRVLGVAEGGNATVDTHVFCARNGIAGSECDLLHDRVRQRLYDLTFTRRVLLVLPVEAPDARQLKLVVREGEQHDLPQLVADFLEFYSMSAQSVSMVLGEVLRRLPAVAMQIPVGLGSKRKVVARFAADDNITAVAEGFANFFEIDDGTKLQILKIARAGMAPGTYVV